MRLNLLFLADHDIDDQQVTSAFLRANSQVSISRLTDFQNFEEHLSNERIDIFVIKAETKQLVSYAKILLNASLTAKFSVIYIMDKEDDDAVAELQNLTAKHILFGNPKHEILAPLITVIVQKDRYKRQLDVMGSYMKDASIVCEKDSDDEFVFKYLNKAYAELESIDATALIGKKVKDSHLLFGLKNLTEEMEEAHDTQTPVHLPNYFYLKEGKREWYDVYIYNSNPDQISIIASNLSEIKRAHDKSTQSNRYLQTILNAQHHVIYITDGVKLINTNQAFLDFFDCQTMHEFVKTHEKVCNIFEKATEPFYIDTNEPMWHKMVSQNSQERYKIRIKHIGVIKVFVPSVEIIMVEEKEQFVVILTDVTELESEKEKLRLLAMTDPLTGASNRLKFNTVIDEFIEVSKRYESPLSIVMFDIDHFKEVNDNHSHQVGDAVLKQLVTVVSNHVRKADIFVRWGGEEFLLVLNNTNSDNAHIAAEKFRKYIMDETFEAVGHITCSFGASTMSETDTISTLIGRADEALYQSKAAGRNKVTTLLAE